MLFEYANKARNKIFCYQIYKNNIVKKFLFYVNIIQIFK